MREILFRGRCNGGPWLYGSLLVYGDGYCEICVPDGEDALEKFRVDPETVGQFTGLTDKNGKKIFEGDIVRVLGDQSSMDWKNVDYIGSVAFIDTGFCIIDGTIEEHGFRRYGMHRMDFTLEVIGNIHDNPELLGGADNEGNS